MKTAGNVIALPQTQRTRAELAFLPAALEIVETPPHLIVRAIMWVVAGIFTLALLGACIAKVNIVAAATGKIVAGGRIKTVQPFETGVVRAIYVQDGQRVSAGAPLIDLDPTINAAELNHLKADLLAVGLDIARLRAQLTSPDNPMVAYVPPREASPATLAAQRRYLMSQTEERRAKIAALDRQLAQKEAEAATARATVAKLEATIPVYEQTAEINRALIDKKLVVRSAYLETEEKLLSQKHGLVVQRAHLKEVEAAIATTIEDRNHAASEFDRALSGELSDAERKAAGIREDIVKSQEKTKLQHLVSPVDGVVQQLSVHTIGGIVTPAQPLMTVVPFDSDLEIEAMVSNGDIGFIEAGQKAEIKVDTFPYTRYGLLTGRILHVSSDAVTQDPAKEKASQQDSKDAGQSQNLSFAARVSLDAKTMLIDNRLVNLSPGMAVTVEVKTGQRRIIDYILSPIAKPRRE
jgi:hemolysin D